MTAPTPGNGQYYVETSFPTSFSVTKPTGMSAGDSVILVLFRYTDSAVTWPSGFTELLSHTDSLDEINLKIAMKEDIADPGSEPSSYTASWTGNTAGAIAAGAIAGIDGADVLAGTPASDDGFGSPLTFPTMTTDEDDALVLAVSCNYDWYDMPVPSGLTGWIDTDDGGGGNPLDVHYFIQASAGATGNKTATVDGSMLWVAAQIAFKPTAAGGAVGPLVGGKLINGGILQGRLTL